MKKASTFLASVAAASSVALPPVSADQSVAFPSPSPPSSSPKEPLGKPAGPGGGRRGNPAPEEKFSPRFDGLRFIETLVTAHR